MITCLGRTLKGLLSSKSGLWAIATELRQMIIRISLLAAFGDLEKKGCTPWGCPLLSRTHCGLATLDLFLSAVTYLFLKSRSSVGYRQKYFSWGASFFSIHSVTFIPTLSIASFNATASAIFFGSVNEIVWFSSPAFSGKHQQQRQQRGHG